jgi:hypothetical protein
LSGVFSSRDDFIIKIFCLRVELFNVYTTLHWNRNLCLKWTCSLWNNLIVNSVWALWISNTTLSSLHHFVLRTSLQIHCCVLLRQSLCCFLSLLLFDSTTFRVNRFYVSRLIFIVRKIVLCDWPLNTWNINWPLSTMHLVCLIAWRLYNTCEFVSRHWILCWGHYGFSSWFLLTYNYISVLSWVAGSTDWRCLFRSSLLLTFLAILVASLFLFCWNSGLLCGTLYCFLDSGRMFWAALLCIRVGTIDFIVEA